jgi:putative glutamine amidotransferase
MSKPRIAYTTRNFSLDPLQWLIDISIRVAGGVPVRVSPRRPKYDQEIDGLIIGGGTDLYPALHKLAPKPNYKYDPPRDELEMTWLKRAEAETLPVLGICRGAQLLNVMRGGTLHVDVAKAYEDAKYPANIIARIFFRKLMNVEEDSLLQNIFKTHRIAVNSMHNQAIDKVGRGLVVSAHEDNGVVQAVEDRGKAFYLGVQFHPEALIYKRVFRQLFKRFVEVARDG